MNHFPTQWSEIKKRLESIQPLRYAKTRNYRDGALTYLSPYISRGMISTRKVYEQIFRLSCGWNEAEKLIQELAWRDYFQQIWLAKGEEIFHDLKHSQIQVENYKISNAIKDANTGVEAIDESILHLYSCGYMHNHMRMYVASICCNVAKSHWLQPACWLYAHLLDGDLASNHLSWQWVAGTFSNKKYYANQENINRYFYSAQKNTFLDFSYEELTTNNVPDILRKNEHFQLQTSLPKFDFPSFESDKITLIYNYYNLDPNWHKDENVQRIFLLEPSIFEKYPVSAKCMDFAIALSKNISDVKVLICEFSELLKYLSPDLIRYKEHPLNKHYQGIEEEREWMSQVKGYFPSFFSFWKKCKKDLQKENDRLILQV